VSDQSVDYLRQLGILAPKHWKQTHVTLIGAGGIGSPTAIMLAKMGLPNLTIWDLDKLEPHNLPSQFYRIRDLGRYKAEALHEIVMEFALTKTSVVLDHYGEDSPDLEGIVISAVDSMAARKTIWRRIQASKKVQFYVEARMGAQQFGVYSLSGPDLRSCDWYEGTLYSDEEAFEAPCTEMAIMYTTFGIACFIGNQITRFLRKENPRREVVAELTAPYIMVDSLFAEPLDEE